MNGTATTEIMGELAKDQEALRLASELGAISQAPNLLLALAKVRDNAKPAEKDRVVVKRDRDGSSKAVLYASPASYGAEWKRASHGQGLHVFSTREEVIYLGSGSARLRRFFVLVFGSPDLESAETLPLGWREAPAIPGPDFPIDKALSTAAAFLRGQVYRELLDITPTGEDLAEEPESKDRPYGPPKKAPAETQEAPEGPRTVVKPGDSPKRPGVYDLGVMRPVKEPVPGASLEENLGQGIPDENVNDPKNNAATETTASGSSSEAQGEGAPSTTGALAAPTTGSSVAAPSSVAQSEGEAGQGPASPTSPTPEAAPVPPVGNSPSDGPSQDLLGVRGITLNCVDCSAPITTDEKAFVDENDEGPYCEECWNACASCGCSLNGKEFCEVCKKSKAEALKPEASFSCDYCQDPLKTKAAKTLHERACKNKPHRHKPKAQEGPSEAQGKPRDPHHDPIQGDKLGFEGWTYTVLEVTPREGHQTRLRLKKDWIDSQGVQCSDEYSWPLGKWRAFWRERKAQEKAKTSKTVSEALSGLTPWKEEA